MKETRSSRRTHDVFFTEDIEGSPKREPKPVEAARRKTPLPTPPDPEEVRRAIQEQRDLEWQNVGDN